MKLLKKTLICVATVSFLSACTPSADINPAYAPLTESTAYYSADNKTISKQQAVADLEQLVETIKRRHSYIHSVDYDYKAAIEHIKNNLGSKVNVAELAMQINKLTQYIGDNHAMVTGWQQLLMKGYSPFKFGYYQDKFFAYWPDRSGFVDVDTPMVTAIDGVDMQQWFDKASLITSGKGASESTKKGRNLFVLEHINHLRKELGLAISPQVTFSLSNLEGNINKKLTVQLFDKYQDNGKPFALPEQSRMLANNIGYLRIHSQRHEELRKSITPWMNEFKDTKALIIDARQCGGGRRHNLRELFPHFMRPDQAPYIANVAKYRIPNSQENFDPIGKLGVEKKNLKHVTNPIVSPEEAVAFEQFKVQFKPSWQANAPEFTDWYFMPINPVDSKYYYDKPVYMLVDWGVGSAGDIFTSAFKGWPNFTLVGAATNGRSGQSRNFELNNSKIKVKLSTMASYQNTGEKYDWVGIQPDVYMEAEMADWLATQDSILERTLELIEK